MISIVVPVYNAARYIGECIESVMRQSYTDWELIVVNDGSTDNSDAVIAEYSGDNRIKYMSKTNSGVTETRWMGVEASQGDIIMFLDADDILTPDALEFVSSNFSADIDILSFEMQSVKDKAELKPIGGKNDAFSIVTNQVEIAESILLGEMLSCVWGGAYWRTILDGCKDIFCSGLRIAEDTMFNLELAVAKPLRVKKTTARIYGYRVNEASMTRAVTERRFQAVNDAINYLEAFAKRNSGLARNLADGIAFRTLLLWSTFMFHPSNRYYRDKAMRRRMRRLYPKAFPHLYPYLRVYLIIDLFIGPWLSQKLINSSFTS